MYRRRKNAGPSIKTDFREIAFAHFIFGNVCVIIGEGEGRGWKKAPIDGTLHGF